MFVSIIVFKDIAYISGAVMFKARRLIVNWNTQSEKRYCQLCFSEQFLGGYKVISFSVRSEVLINIIFQSH